MTLCGGWGFWGGDRRRLGVHRNLYSDEVGDSLGVTGGREGYGIGYLGQGGG